MSKNTALNLPSQGKTSKKGSPISQAPSVMRIWGIKRMNLAKEI